MPAYSTTAAGHRQDGELYLSNHFKKNRQGGHSQLCFSIEESIRELAHIDLEGKTAGEICDNEEILTNLKELVAVGKCADQDLQKSLKIKKEKSKVFGLTGKCLQTYNNDKALSDGYVGVDDEVMPAPRPPCAEFELAKDDCNKKLDFFAQTLEQDFDKLKAAFTNLDRLAKDLQSTEVPYNGQESGVEQSLNTHDALEAKLTKLVAETSQAMAHSRWLPDLSSLCDALTAMMQEWRVLQTKMHFKLAAEMDTQDIFRELHALYSKAYGHIHHAQGKLAEIRRLQICSKFSDLAKKVGSWEATFSNLKRNILNDAWSFDKLPPPSILVKEKMDLSVRLFGLQESWIEMSKAKLAVFLQSDFEKRCESQGNCSGARIQIGESGTDEGLEVLLTGLEVPRNMGSLKRNSALHFERFVRVSLQLSVPRFHSHPVECISPPFTTRTGSGQLWPCIGALVWYCFSAEKNLYVPPFKYPNSLTIEKVLELIVAMIRAADQQKIFFRDEYDSLVTMLQSLIQKDSRSNLIGIKEFVMDKLPSQGKQGSNRDFSCFTWCIAAINTHKILADQVNDLPIHSFMNNDKCEEKLNKLSEGCALIRVSSNQVDGPSGQEPQARIVIQVRCGGKGLHFVKTAAKIQKYSLPTMLQRCQTKNVKHCCTKLALLQEISLMDFINYCKGSNIEGNFNGYRKTAKKPGAEVALDEDMNDSDSDSCLPMDCDEPNIGEVSVKPKAQRLVAPDEARTGSVLQPSTSHDFAVDTSDTNNEDTGYENIDPSINEFVSLGNVSIFLPVPENNDSLWELLDSCSDAS